jgi:cytochrome P450
VIEWKRHLAPNEVAIIDGKASKLLYGHGSSATKSRWYATWEPPLKGAHSVFATRDQRLHAFLRKRIAGAYAMSSILKYEPLIQDSLNLLLQKFQSLCAGGNNRVDLSTWTSALAFGIVGQLGFGAPIGHLAADAADVHSLRKTIFDGFVLMSSMGHYYIGICGYFWGQMRLFTNRAVKVGLQFLGQNNPLADFEAWGIPRLKSRAQAGTRGEEGREDMLAHFIKMSGAQGEPLSFNEVLVEALGLVGAGADTTATAMRSCVYYICTHPRAYKRLQSEIDAFYAIQICEQPITYLQTQSLPYLMSCCREAMRLLPSITFQLLRYSPPGGLYVDGKYIPEGVEVGISPLAQNRDPVIWGPDADDFRPERWLESEDLARQLGRHDLTFGGNGPRMCLGRNIALVEVQKFVAQLFRLFDVQVTDHENPWKMMSHWFVFQSEFWCEIKPRNGVELLDGCA